VRAPWPHPALLQLLSLQAEALEGVVDVAGKALTPGGLAFGGGGSGPSGMCVCSGMCV
jgi:hypothetical protein